MTIQIAFLFALLGGMVYLFLTEKLPVDLTAFLGLVVLVSMVGACMGSGVFGVLVPLTLRRFGADPAMASSIFLTTFTDVLGMGLMLFLATSVLL